MRKFLVAVLGMMVAVVLMSCFRAESQAKSAPTATSLRSDQASADQTTPLGPTFNEWKARPYPGSAITIDQTVAETDSYTQYVTSYYSDGLRISALLTVPKGNAPSTGWPVFVWNHGGADPKQYGRQNDDQVGKEYASRGYITFQPAYRGYAGSDGDPNDSSGYGIDSLNAIASIQRYPGADGSKVGVGGHSLGGAVTLFDLLISRDIKAAISVAGNFVSVRERLAQAAQLAAEGKLSATEQQRWKLIEDLMKTHGSPSENPEFWDQYDFMAHLSEITAPVQFHHGLRDDAAPWQQSQRVYESLKRLQKPVEFYTYPEGDHQLTGYTAEVLTRTVEFLDRHLKKP